MFVLHHVLDYLRIALQQLHPCQLLIFGRNGQIDASFADQLAMGPIVVLGSDVVFDENVDLDVGVHREGEEPLLLKGIQTVLPIYPIFGPHLPKCLQADPLLPPCVVLQQLIKSLLIKNLTYNLEKRNKFRIFQLPPHKQIQFFEYINNLIILIRWFLNSRLRIDKRNDKINPLTQISF